MTMPRCLPVSILLLLTFTLRACSSTPALPEETSFTSVTPVPHAGEWQPKPGTSYQIQFSGEIDLAVDAQLYELDAFDTDSTIVDQLHQAGRKVICYINAGSFENWRPDADQFPPEVIGRAYSGWPGEHWLDIRRLDVLAPILENRIEICRSKGFDGIEFDNMDGYQNKTGFDLTAADQLAFNRWLADAAHAQGLVVGLKNDPDQIAALEPWFDFVLLESCFEQGWCEKSMPFLEAGKAVIDIEYSPITTYCAEAEELSISLIEKRRELDAQRRICT